MTVLYRTVHARFKSANIFISLVRDQTANSRTVKISSYTLSNYLHTYNYYIYLIVVVCDSIVTVLVQHVLLYVR